MTARVLLDAANALTRGDRATFHDLLPTLRTMPADKLHLLLVAASKAAVPGMVKLLLVENLLPITEGKALITHGLLTRSHPLQEADVMALARKELAAMRANPAAWEHGLNAWWAWALGDSKLTTMLKQAGLTPIVPRHERDTIPFSLT